MVQMISNRDFCYWAKVNCNLDIKPNTDLIDDAHMNYDTFVNFIERVMIKYNRLIPINEFKDLYNGSRIVKYLNSHDIPKDESSKMKLLRMRLNYYSKE